MRQVVTESCHSQVIAGGGKRGLIAAGTAQIARVFALTQGRSAGPLLGRCPVYHVSKVCATARLRH